MADVEVFYESWGLERVSAFDYASDDAACAALRKSRVGAGVCSIAGELDTFILFGSNFREDLVAARSGSTSRTRSVAVALSWSQFGHPFASLRTSCEALVARSAQIYMPETSGAFHHAMQTYTGAALTSSEYFGPEYRSGDTVRGKRHEDLQHLSFADATFELIITQDVMEHVADAPAAEAEIVRVLRPGGWYLFTIPFYFTLPHDRIRASLRPDGTVQHFESPEYHGDPVRPEGVLVFRDFSDRDMRERFTALGCSFEIFRTWSPALGIVGPDQVIMAVQRLR